MSYLTNPYMVTTAETGFESITYELDNDNRYFTSLLGVRDGIGIRVVAGSSLIGMEVGTVDMKFQSQGTVSCGTVVGKLYEDATNGNSGTLKGTSDNSVDCDSITSEDTVTWDFSGTSTANKTLAENWGIIIVVTDTSCSGYPSPYITLRGRSTTADIGEFLMTEFNGGASPPAFEDRDTDKNPWLAVRPA